MVSPTVVRAGAAASIRAASAAAGQGARRSGGVFKHLNYPSSSSSTIFRNNTNNFSTTSSTTRSLTEFSSSSNYIPRKSHSPSAQFRGFATTPRNMVVKEINSMEEWKAALEVKDKLIVLDCYAVWCGPCKAISPILEKASEDVQQADFIKIDVDKLPQLAQELGIKAMPTFLFFKNGEKVNEIVGANPPVLLNYITSNA